MAQPVVGGAIEVNLSSEVLGPPVTRGTMPSGERAYCRREMWDDVGSVDVMDDAMQVENQSHQVGHC